MTTNSMVEKVDIQEYLSRYEGQKVYYIPNPGNAGDSLIALATYQQFKRAGVKYEVVQSFEEFDEAEKVVFYAGVGNLIHEYNDAHKWIKKCHKKAKKLVVLPHTIKGNKKLLKSLGKNTEIICREKKSYKWVNLNTDRVGTYLSHDMALSLDVSKSKEKIPYSWASLLAKSFIKNVLKKKKPPYLPLRKGAKIMKKVTKFHLKNLNINSGGVLNAYRTDTESTDVEIPNDNIDISEVYKLGTNENLSLISSVGLLNFMQNFDVVNTNRLHGCIAGILMNKKVNFYPNNYFKNRAVYNHSIKGVYENVNWMGQS